MKETASGLTIIDAHPPGDLPEGLLERLLERGAERLHEVLPGPTLIHLPGRRPEPLFVSVLLHGNETTGWAAARRVLARYAGGELPRALSLFVGNVAAARQGLRTQPGQADYNRIWNGGTGRPRREHALAREVLDEMRRRRVFACVDVHNNTGFNPHYGCVNRLEAPYLHLAALFSRTVVYFIRPKEVLSMAFAELCPAATVECGQPGQAHGEAHAAEYLEACLHLQSLPTHSVAAGDVDLFHTVAVVKLRAGSSVGIETDEADLSLIFDIDRLNFNELPAGTALGWVRTAGLPVQAWNEQGEEVSERYFALADGELRTRVPVMPSMLTRDADVIRADCLCYLMERLEATTGGGA